jgi:hypothetical protein
VSVEGDGYDERLALADGELARLVRRLRSLPPASWDRRRRAILMVLDQLSAVTAAAENTAVPALPDLPDHALADAVAVLGGDVIVALNVRPDGDLLASFTAAVRGALNASR